MIQSMNYKSMYVIIAVNDWKIEQMNVKIVFLYDKIHEKVFVYNSQASNKESIRSAS
jgi:hypothetical protein